MSAAINNHLSAHADASKASSKKKRGKIDTSASTPTPSNPDLDTVKSESVVNGVNGAADDGETTFLKELQRNLRNALKKLNATTKVDSIIAENPGKSLEDLVAEKKINADQKAQALKKPALQAQVAQIEEQISQYKQFAAHYEERLTSQKTALETAHKEELEAAREEAVAQLKKSQEAASRVQLLTLSKFLRSAASVRRSGDEAAVESQAFEGVLLQVYGGNQDAVDSMLKVINGVDEKVTAVDGQVLDVTYARVKELSNDQGASAPAQEPIANSSAASDPTIANAGLTELEDAPVSNTADASAFGSASHEVQATEPALAPTQTAAGNGANSVAASWEHQTSTDDWVEVERNVPETEHDGLSTTAAAVAAASGSWAEDVPTGAAPVEGTDGFEQVIHHQRQNSTRGRGGGRGRGRGDGFRGHGGRGGGRGEQRGRGGRGRGEFKGGRGRGGLGGQNGNRREVVATN